MKNTNADVTNATGKSSEALRRGVLLIGTGAVAVPYLKFAHENEHLKLVAIADPNATARKEAEEKYGPVVSVSDYKEVIDRPDIDLVIVCTPHFLHHSMVTSALNAGKHVICEKPIAITLAEADEMLDAAARNKKMFLVTMNMFFNPWAIGIRRLLGEKKLGKVFMAQSSYLGYEVARLRDPRDWKGDLQKAGGGVLLDGGYHIIYTMNSWMGEAKSVQMTGGQYVIGQPHKGEDNAALLVEYEGGAIGNLIVSFTVCSPGCHEQPTLHLEHNLWGTDGSVHSLYHWDPIGGLSQCLEFCQPREGMQSIDLKAISTSGHLPHYIACLAQGTTPQTTALDARNALAVVEAAYASMKTGKKQPVNWRKTVGA
jgi:predicted dehydrogenase